jgi:hypothetical protein
MQRPPLALFHKDAADRLRTIILLICIGILAIFSYLSYIAYTVTLHTPYFAISYVIISPVFVAFFLFILLVAIGRHGFYKEYESLQKYKVKVMQMP